MANGADVILVPVGYEDRLRGRGSLQPGQDQVDAGAGIHVPEGHAQIDQDETPLSRRRIHE